VLFPNQLIRVSTTGFEAERFDDSIASLSLSFVQVPAENKAVADDGTGKYTMYYQIEEGEKIGPAQLSDAAQTRYNAYSLIDSGPLAGTHAPMEGVFNAGFGDPRRSPLVDVKDNSEAIGSIMGMSVRQLHVVIERAKHDKHNNLTAFFADLKRVLHRAEGSDGKAQACEFVKNLKFAIPKSLWRKHGFEAEPCGQVKTK
jgi:hypothetical protein